MWIYVYVLSEKTIACKGLIIQSIHDICVFCIMRRKGCSIYQGWHHGHFLHYWHIVQGMHWLSVVSQPKKSSVALLMFLCCEPRLVFQQKVKWSVNNVQVIFRWYHPKWKCCNQYFLLTVRQVITSIIRGIISNIISITTSLYIYNLVYL